MIIKNISKDGTFLLGNINNKKFQIDLTKIEDADYKINNITNEELLIILKKIISMKYIPSNTARILSELSYFFTIPAIEVQALADISVDAACDIKKNPAKAGEVLNELSKSKEIKKIKQDFIKEIDKVYTKKLIEMYKEGNTDE